MTAARTLTDADVEAIADAATAAVRAIVREEVERADVKRRAVMDVVRVCSAVLDHEAAPVAQRERSGR